MQVNCFIMSKSFFIPAVLVILVMFVPGKLKATGLTADAIYINGEKWDLYAWPINKLYSGRLQDFLKERVGTAVMEKTTANPRGYNCTWEIKDGKIELGYVIDPGHKNRGYATEALTAAIKALLDMGYDAVRTAAFEGNIPSIRVMEKSGMDRMDFTDELEYRGVTHRCVWFEKRKC